MKLLALESESLITLWLVNVKNRARYNWRVYYLQWQKEPLMVSESNFSTLICLCIKCFIIWPLPSFPASCPVSPTSFCPHPYTHAPTHKHTHIRTRTHLSLPLPLHPHTDSSDAFQVVISRPLSGMNEHSVYTVLTPFIHLLITHTSVMCQSHPFSGRLSSSLLLGG